MGVHFLDFSDQTISKKKYSATGITLSELCFDQKKTCKMVSRASDEKRKSLDII